MISKVIVRGSADGVNYGDLFVPRGDLDMDSPMDHISKTSALRVSTHVGDGCYPSGEFIDDGAVTFVPASYRSGKLYLSPSGGVFPWRVRWLRFDVMMVERHAHCGTCTCTNPRTNTYTVRVPDEVTLTMAPATKCVVRIEGVVVVTMGWPKDEGFGVDLDHLCRLMY